VFLKGSSSTFQSFVPLPTPPRPPSSQVKSVGATTTFFELNSSSTTSWSPKRDGGAGAKLHRTTHNCVRTRLCIISRARSNLRVPRSSPRTVCCRRCTRSCSQRVGGSTDRAECRDVQVGVLGLHVFRVQNVVEQGFQLGSLVAFAVPNVHRC
jgi:hypothetical protein